MPNVNEIYQSEFLNADQLGGQARRAVIEATSVEVIGQGENASQKIILKFTKGKARLPLNKTNARVLADAWGPVTENWVGRSVELRPEKVLFSGRMVPAIRVHAVKAAAPGAAPAVAPEPPDGVADMADDVPWEQ